MKVITKSIYCLFLVLLLWSCADIQTDVGNPHWAEGNTFVGSSVSGLTHKERHEVMKDTITPPNNPMNERPFLPGTHTFRGVLELKYFEGELFCAIRSVNNNDYFLIDNGASHLFRLNNQLLSDCVVGDTIVVMAEPMKLVDDFSLATYYIQPNK